MTPSIQAAVQTADFSQDTWWIWALKAAFIIVFLIMNVILALWVERRGLARMQTRLGPNRVGPLGLGQAFADAVKLLIKEDFWLKGADKIVYFVAPFIGAVCAFTVMAVVPMGPNVSIFGHSTPLRPSPSCSSSRSPPWANTGWCSADGRPIPPCPSTGRCEGPPK
mgnify:CR=1 FL=1